MEIKIPLQNISCRKSTNNIRDTQPCNKNYIHYHKFYITQKRGCLNSDSLFHRNKIQR